VLGGFRLQAERARISLHCAGPARSLAVRADVLRLKQVLANLISNAIKYNRAGGQVTVAIASRTAASKSRWRDTGLGIPTERMAELFQPSSALGARPWRRRRRFGPCAHQASCRGHARRASRGEFGGKGSTFTARLAPAPLADLKRPQRARPLRAQPSSSRTRWCSTSRTTARISNSCAMSSDAFGGLELHVAEHPLKGLEDAERLRRTSPAGHQPADIDGFEVKARLDVNPATCRIPVIALSPTSWPTRFRAEQTPASQLPDQAAEHRGAARGHPVGRGPGAARARRRNEREGRGR